MLPILRDYLERLAMLHEDIKLRSAICRSRR
jgi:hypothetical protein